jgi:hypothetical protein
MCERCLVYKERERELLEVIRKQGEFIQKIKSDVRDFQGGGITVRMTGRAIADRGFRRT